MAGSGNHLCSGSAAHGFPNQGTAADGGAPPARGRFDAIVELNRPLCREHYLLRLRVPGGFPPTDPGQFVQLGCRSPLQAIDVDALRGRVWDVGPEGGWFDRPGADNRVGQPELCGPLALLRRPFSIAERGDDDRGTWLDVIHRVVGIGTAWLETLKLGEAVDLIGPLGNGFDLPESKRVGLLVGGGVGLPPMLYLARVLREAGWDVVAFIGAQTRDLLPVSITDEPDRDATPRPCVAEFARHGCLAVVATDDGSLGLEGRITDGLDRHLKLSGGDALGDALSEAVVFACGPEPMLRAAAVLTDRYGVACQVCVEQAMACGMGTCQSCVVKIKNAHDGASASGVSESDASALDDWTYRLACTHGPVFDAERVVWSVAI